MARIKSIGIAVGAKKDYERRKKRKPKPKYEKAKTGETLPAGTEARMRAGMSTWEERKAKAEAEEAAAITPEPEKKGVVKEFAERKGAFDIPIFGEKQGKPIYDETGKITGFTEPKTITAGETLALGATAAAPSMLLAKTTSFLAQAQTPKYSGIVTKVSRGGTLADVPILKRNILTNTKMVTLATNYLTKMARFAVDPRTVAGVLIGSSMMGIWAKGEFIDGLSFLLRDAEKNQDEASIERLRPLIEDLTNKSTIENLQEAVGPKGFVDQAVVNKLKILGERMRQTEEGVDTIYEEREEMRRFLEKEKTKR